MLVYKDGGGGGGGLDWGGEQLIIGVRLDSTWGKDAAHGGGINHSGFNSIQYEY